MKRLRFRFTFDVSFGDPDAGEEAGGDEVAQLPEAYATTVIEKPADDEWEDVDTEVTCGPSRQSDRSRRRVVGFASATRPRVKG